MIPLSVDFHLSMVSSKVRHYTWFDTQMTLHHCGLSRDIGEGSATVGRAVPGSSESGTGSGEDTHRID